MARWSVARRPAARFVGLLGFQRRPVVAAVLVASLLVGWIVLGTALVDPIATSPTREFIRDGLVRWPFAVMAGLALWRVGRSWSISTFGRPRRPTRVPWATAALALGTLGLASQLTGFWSDGSYTAAVFFSEMSTGVVEEVVFRGLVFCGLVAGLGRSSGRVKLAAYLSCALFGLAHVLGGWESVLVTAFLGALFLASTVEMQSLWPAAVLHGLLDVGIKGGDDTGVEVLLVGGNLVLLGGSVAALVAFALWGDRWPVEAEGNGFEAR